MLNLLFLKKGDIFLKKSRIFPWVMLILSLFFFMGAFVTMEKNDILGALYFNVVTLVSVLLTPTLDDKQDDKQKM